MSYRIRWTAVAVAMACGAAAGLAVPGGRAAASSSPGPAAGRQARQAARFWTARRMAEAGPLDAGRAAPGGSRPGAAGAGRPQGTLFKGTPLVGTFFGSDGPSGTTWRCTGSVIDTAVRDVVLTAAHCALNMKGDYVFVPQFARGAGPDRQPYGIFPVQHLYIDPRYTPDKGASTTKGPSSDLDTAFARVAPNQSGQSVQDAVGGGLTFTRPGGYTQKNVTVVGYPSYAHNSTGQAVKCTVPTAQLPGYRQMSMTCGGYYGGTSGSPWITDYQDGARTGHVIGNLGGYNGGGNDANADYISYAPAFGADAANLLADAVAGQDPPSGLPPYQGLQLPGGARRWKSAALMTSADYTGDGLGDLLVVWSDGAVTLYPGDGQGEFGAEKRLLKANSTWTHARGLAGGTFGGDRPGLLVRWSDGEVTLYPAPGPSGMGREVRMAKQGSDWKNVVQFTAGQFHGGKGTTDLLARRTDGSLVLYTGIRSGSFGTGRRLLGANGAWTKAALLSGGTLRGTAGADLLVRWSDGSLDTRTGVSASGIGTRAQLRGPNGTWQHAQVMTTGDLTADHVRNDLVVRWSDGETSLYADTGAKSLGTENTLVPAGT
ncbi:trypsin-like serine peptidase [Streptomyces sp. NBC_00557]|uniref:trypsin-like serine peptidase n=1 Tax=Streptomyces sp. NBC_00557 TaxID=2975776 RepID=UPI002E803338|nr:trypsin-like serine protease [Streptomyces sp. NBC_00557]WUC33998.1 trypsin-like serine protease [Streptomyces sp. NBC_00557]